jgi:hypothetical protein
MARKKDGQGLRVLLGQGRAAFNVSRVRLGAPFSQRGKKDAHPLRGRRACAPYKEALSFKWVTILENIILSN